MNDRQRTEALLFPIWFLNLMDKGARNKADEDYRVVRQHLIEACDDALRGCDDRKITSLTRRAMRLHNEITQGFVDERARVDKVGLVAIYVLQSLLESDYLVLDEGSNLSEAVHAIMYGLEEPMSKDKVNASARKQADRVLRDLRSKGYYVDHLQSNVL